MNANELAKYLDRLNGYMDMPRDILDITQPAAIMIRQQQAEIEALKKDNKELHAIAQRMAMAESDARKSLQWFKDAKERQNEPVAWMVNGNAYADIFEAEHYSKFTNKPMIPLYTHPADESFDRTASHMAGEYVSYPAKTLTDEEIMKCVKQFTYARYYDDFFKFAKKLLRKAQEK